MLHCGIAFAISAAAVVAGAAAEPDLHLPGTEWIWSNAPFPSCVVGCEKVVDGPMTANGDLGVAIGASASGIELALGKNDFWGCKLTCLFDSMCFHSDD